MMNGMMSCDEEYLMKVLFMYSEYSTKYSPILSIIWYCYKKYEYLNKFGSTRPRRPGARPTALRTAWGRWEQRYQRR